MSFSKSVIFPVVVSVTSTLGSGSDFIEEIGDAFSSSIRNFSDVTQLRNSLLARSKRSITIAPFRGISTVRARPVPITLDQMLKDKNTVAYQISRYKFDLLDFAKDDVKWQSMIEKRFSYSTGQIDQKVKELKDICRRSLSVTNFQEDLVKELMQKCTDFISLKQRAKKVNLPVVDGSSDREWKSRLSDVQARIIFGSKKRPVIMSSQKIYDFSSFITQDQIEEIKSICKGFGDMDYFSHNQKGELWKEYLFVCAEFNVGIDYWFGQN